MGGRKVGAKGQGVGELAGKFITEKLYIQGQIVGILGPPIQGIALRA